MINNALQDTLPCRYLSHMRKALPEAYIILLETIEATNKEEGAPSLQEREGHRNVHWKLQILVIQQILFPWKFLTLQYELLYKEANKETHSYK